MTDFFEQGYDDATRIKLQIFRGYIKEWIPVFLTSTSHYFDSVNIFDFFSGPGKDSKGNPGSPLIIVEELKKFCKQYGSIKSEKIKTKLYFNDINPDFIANLKSELERIRCSKSCCNLLLTAEDFKISLSRYLPLIQANSSANLIILDQFGVSEVTPTIVGQLSKCSTTDIIFFISSSFIRRFIETPEICSKFNISPGDMKNIEYNSIHRFICSYYQNQIQNKKYYLAPFSIKKGSNIYGLIFCSSNLLGLEKFLKVCWKMDQVTGEANFNIDNDLNWYGEGLLFAELNTVNKKTIFENELLEFIRDNKPDNRELYEFTLSKGFLSTHVCDILKPIRNSGQINIRNIKNSETIRPNAYYLSYQYYTEEPRIRYALCEAQ